MSKLRKTVISLVTLIFSCMMAYAQTGDVKVLLVDKASGEPLGFATVSLTPKNSSKVYKYVLSNDKGEVKIEKVKAGNYMLKVELMGYQSFQKEIAISGGLDMGKVEIGEDKQVIDAAKVSAAANPIIVKKDTIEYNASSFKTTDNDVLEDLLKKLPGIEVSEDGSITMNGEAIKKITIDGKTFFLDDPQLASKNIPAKIINKVKVVEKKSEQAAFTGIEDGEDEKIIDLSVKPGMMKGVFGNVMAGAGHDVPNTATEYDDTRYQGAAFVGKFTDKSQISLILNANNTNNRGFNDLSGSMMGDMRGGGGMGRGQGGWGGGNGITTSYMGGVNGAWTLLDDRMELGGNYLFNATEKDVLEKSSRTTHYDDYDLISLNDGASLNNSYGHRLGMRLDHKFSENTSILFQPSLNFGTGNYTETSNFSTDTDYGSSLVNTNKGFKFNSGENKNWSTDGFFLLRQRLGLPGRTLTAMVRYSFSNNLLDGYNQSLTTSFSEAEPLDSIVNQRFDYSTKRKSITGRLTYTEPLGNHFYVEANYEYGWTDSRSVKNTYDSFDQLGFDVQRPVYNPIGETLNEIYSNSVLNRYVNQSAGANMLYQNDGLRAQVGFAAKPTYTHNETTRRGQPQVYESKVLNWAPQAMVFYDISENANLRTFYFGRSAQPSNNQLMPVPDNSDPLRVSFGNPTLKPYFSHSLRGDFRYNNRKTFSSVNVGFNGGIVQSPIVNATWRDKYGVQYSMPFNGPLSGNVGMNMFANIPIGKSKFSVSNMSRVNYSHSSYYEGGNKIDMSPYYHDGELDYTAFLNDYSDIASSEDFKENTNQSLNVVERLRLTYRSDNLELRTSGRTRFNRSWFSVNQAAQTKTWNNQVAASIRWTWDAPGLDFKSDYEFNWYRGYASAQPSEHVMNIEIDKLLFKKKMTLALKGYDIFGQSKNLSVSDTANYHLETLNNTLGRYIILSLTYRFGTMDKGRMGGPGYGPGPGPGMRGPGPGR